MKSLNSSKMWLLFVGFVLLSTLPLLRLWAVQIPEVSSNVQESSEVIIMIAGHEHRYQTRPDLGFVVVAQDDSDAIASVYRDSSLFTQNEKIVVIRTSILAISIMMVGATQNHLQH